MKKSIKPIMFLITTLLVVSLVGCAGTPTTAPATTEAPTEAPTEVPTEAPTEKPTEAPTEEKVTVRYAHWNLGTEEENNIQRQLIQAYMDLHPNVTIELVDMSDPNGVGWEALLTGYAAKGELPDVFAANNVPLYYSNGWLADVTDLVENDPDWEYIPQALKDAFTYSGRVLGIPSGQFIMGYFVNQDLYEAANLTAPEYGVSVEEFLEVSKQLTDIEKGVLGLDEKFPIMGWYPSTVDSNLGWYSFDGTKMNYNSAAFKEAVAVTEEMIPYTWQGLTDEQKANFKSQGPWELFLNQEVGAKWDASWNFVTWGNQATFNWDFIGIPGGNQAIVFDAIAISQTAPNLEEAFNFAKWMTFSIDGYKKQVELCQAAGTAPNLPVAITDETLELFKVVIDKPGVNKALENLDNSLLESLAKVVPGYVQARWEGKPGIDIGENQDVSIGWIFDNVGTGQFKYEDCSAQLEEFANQILADAAKQIAK